MNLLFQPWNSLLIGSDLIIVIGFHLTKLEPQLSNLILPLIQQPIQLRKLIINPINLVPQIYILFPQVDIFLN